MHCPHCGQQQVNDVIRFCSRCGFPLEGVMQVLASGGILPFYPPEPREPSPRKKGVRQGGLLLLLGILIVPMLGILSTFAPGRIDVLFELLCALSAIVFFVGGLMRMLYAALFEEGAARPHPLASPYISPAMPAQLGVVSRSAALPPATGRGPTGWQQRSDTAELVHRPSVTENTTRLLGKEDPNDR